MISRRGFLGALAAAGTGNLLGVPPGRADAQAPPETTTIRIAYGRRGICVAPQYVAEELLRSEGFTSVEYVKNVEGIGAQADALASGEINMLLTFAAPLIIRIDAGAPILMLAGGHVGCFELFGTERVRAIRDLKGKTIAIIGRGLTPHHVYMSTMLAYVGIDPGKDVTFVEHPFAKGMQLLAERKIDAYLGFPPRPAGAPGPEDRPRGGQQRDRPTVVPVLLLHGNRQPRVRPQAPSGHEAGAPRHAQSS
jgi:NitT/TauT family transport system substrate-binding protein